MSLPAAGLAAQLPLPDTSVTRSLSGQFIIHDQRHSGPSPISDLLATNSQVASFDPMVLGVSCERIKQDLSRRLGLNPSAADKIHVVLHTASVPNEVIAITRERFLNAWQYRIDLPDSLERVRYVRAIVHVLLLEFANRSAGARSAELPIWLTDGFSQELLSSEALEVIVPPARKTINGVVLTSISRNERRKDPLAYARLQLRSHAMLTFDDLSWPKDEGWTAESDELFRLSSQLFVNELLALENAPANLRQMLSALPDRYNWQVAFLSAFSADFPRLLEVEKWWTVRFLHFTAREPAQNWSLEESWRRLEQVLRESVEIRQTTNDLPVPDETTLQTVVNGWDAKPQTQALESKLRQLELIRPRLAPPLAPVADSYHQTLTGYLQEAKKSRSWLSFGKKAKRQQAQSAAVENLNQLDARLSALRPSLEALASGTQPSTPPVVPK